MTDSHWKDAIMEVQEGSEIVAFGAKIEAGNILWTCSNIAFRNRNAILLLREG